VTYEKADAAQQGIAVVATAKSSGLNDVAVTFCWSPYVGDLANAVEIITWKMTAFAPAVEEKDIDDWSVYIPAYGYCGYDSEYIYRTIYDNDHDVIWTGLDVNETLDEPGTLNDQITTRNWSVMLSPQLHNGTSDSDALVYDHFMAVDGGRTLVPPVECPWTPPYPVNGVYTPNDNPNPLIFTCTNHIYRAGSLTSGQGLKMGTYTLEYHQHNARQY
jgi:hypothetical protein